MRLGEKIRIFRQMKGYSQEYMAAQLGLNASDYGQMEQGKAKVSTERLVKAAEVLGVKPEDLFWEESGPIFINSVQHVENGVSHQYYQDQELIQSLKATIEAQAELIARLKQELDNRA